MLGALFTPMLALVLTAVSIVSHVGLDSVFNQGAHGFTEAMLFGRYVPLLAALALAGAVANKRSVPASVGTLRTDGPTFSVLLVGVIVLTAGLMLLPALTLGPIVEGLLG